MNPESFNEQLILFLRDLVTDKSFQATYRRSPEHFTRTRALPFDRVIVALCQLTKLSLQGVLNRFFKALGKATQVVSASALCQARQKLHYGALRALNTAVTEYYYRRGEKIRAGYDVERSSCGGNGWRLAHAPRHRRYAHTL